MPCGAARRNEVRPRAILAPPSARRRSLSSVPAGRPCPTTAFGASLPGRGPKLGSPGGAPIMHLLTDRRPSMYARRRHRFAARAQMGTLATCNASVIQTPTLVRRRARDRPTPTGKSSGRYPASATTGLQRSTPAQPPKPLPLRRQPRKERTAVATPRTGSNRGETEENRRWVVVRRAGRG